ncbi:MAG: hypothetical protein NZ992_05435 [Candidatus Korarchaeum sp.]|nr:hypothetical protein [Candidatus Korarchaeum sp.]MDW8036133.1 hypothetical protein [Candidatus Korarchaeum sp.]
MQESEGLELKYKEITAWMLTIPPLVALISGYLSTRFYILDRDLGARISIVLMITAMFIFITADRYVRLLISPKVEDKSHVVMLYRRAMILLGVVIPALGILSTLAVGYPDAPLTSLSFTAISLSGIGSAWKRFYDKLTGAIILPPEEEKRVRKK